MTTSDDSRNWSMIAHFAGTGAQLVVPSFGFLGPLVVMLIRKDDPIVQYHAKQAMVFQLAMTVAIWVIGAVATALSCFLIGMFIYPFAAIPWLAGLILPLVGGVKVSNGEHFTYPMISGMVSEPPELE